MVGDQRTTGQRSCRPIECHRVDHPAPPIESQRSNYASFAVPVLILVKLDRDSGHVAGAGSYWLVQPPSIGMAVPVMLWAIGWHNHAASCPISLGSDIRWLGCFSLSESRTSAWRSPPNFSVRARICGSMMAVSVQPGQIQLTPNSYKCLRNSVLSTLP